MLLYPPVKSLAIFYIERVITVPSYRCAQQKRVSLCELLPYALQIFFIFPFTL